MMEKEYQQILEHYIDMDSRNLSKKYLEKFWLSESEYINHWISIEKNIFRLNSKDLPDLMFNEGYELIVQRGGILFSKEEYSNLLDCMKIAGDKYFVLIENKFKRNTDGDFPHLRFKFPIDTSWESLNNQDENIPDISYETLYIMNKHFFIFGDSAKWGKYAACDYNDTPLDIIGFRPEVARIFKKQFKQSEEEQEEIFKWLPDEYMNF